MAFAHPPTPAPSRPGRQVTQWLRPFFRARLLGSLALTLSGCAGTSPNTRPSAEAPMAQHGQAAQPAPQTSAMQTAGARQAQPKTTQTEAAASTTTTGDSIKADPSGPPALAPDATYLTLLKTLAASGSEDECLIVERDEQWFLGARLSLATQGWPETPAALPAPEVPSQRLSVVTRWGIVRGNLGAQDGRDNEGPVLVGVSEVPASVLTAPAAALLIGPTHTSLWYSDRPARHIASPEAAGVAVVSAAAGGLGSVWLTATRDTSLDRIVAHLRQLPHGLPVGFAIALPAGTRLPADTLARQGKAHCPQGLPSPEGSAPEGDLPQAALLEALTPLQEAARSCLSQARGRAAAGGRVVLALRIGPAGRVRNSCLVEDAIADPTLAACLVEHARQLRFPMPAPSGFVDVHLPLSLSPETRAPSPGFCRRGNVGN